MPAFLSSTRTRETLAQILVLSAGIIGAYVWLNVTVLAQFSLQAFASCVLVYFILKKINEAGVWQVLPTTAVDEMVLVTFAFLILIGATGGTTSVFFSLIFVYLFFVSMTMYRWTSITITLETLLFFYALNPNLNAELNLSHLAGIPLVMVFFLFARYQHEQSKEKQTLINIDKNEIYSYKIYLEQKESELVQAEDKTWDWLYFFENFLFGFLQPKLDQLIEMADFSQNQTAIKGQLTLIRLELEKLKVKIKHLQAANKSNSISAQDVIDDQVNNSDEQAGAADNQLNNKDSQPDITNNQLD